MDHGGRRLSGEVRQAAHAWVNGADRTHQAMKASDGQASPSVTGVNPPGPFDREAVVSNVRKIAERGDQAGSTSGGWGAKGNRTPFGRIARSGKETIAPEFDRSVGRMGRFCGTNQRFYGHYWQS
ncbi:MAG: hypothetical protein AAF668_05680 [Pseudomonadota bacterium]